MAAAKKKADFNLLVPRPENAEDLVRLAWKLETIAENEGISLKSIDICDHEAYHAGGQNGSGLEFYYQSKV